MTLIVLSIIFLSFLPLASFWRIPEGVGNLMCSIFIILLHCHFWHSHPNGRPSGEILKISPHFNRRDDIKRFVNSLVVSNSLPQQKGVGQWWVQIVILNMSFIKKNSSFKIQTTTASIQ